MKSILIFFILVNIMGMYRIISWNIKDIPVYIIKYIITIYSLMSTIEDNTVSLL